MNHSTNAAIDRTRHKADKALTQLTPDTGKATVTETAGAIDRKAADEFLFALDPPARRWTFQTFDEAGTRKSGALVKLLHGSFGQHAATLADLNARGAGVYVTVNETDGKGRKAANITRVRAVFIDLDGAPLEPVESGPLAPHIVVETSPGRWHCYWRIADCPFDRFRLLQQHLIQRFEADKAVHDLPRVMRLPGFCHRKDEPFMVRMVENRAGEYTLAEFTEAFGIEPTNRRKPAARSSASNTGTDPVLSEALAAIPPEDYGVWLSVGMALRDGGHPDGFALWCDWSARSDKFPGADELRRKWDTFKPGGHGHGNIIELAKRHGWRKITTGRHKSGTTGTTGTTASNDGAYSGSPEESAGTTGTTNTRKKPEVDRPCFATHDDWTGYGRPGLYWHGVKNKDDDVVETDDWIASPIHAVAVTSNEKEGEIGLYLRFLNPFGRWVNWAAPMRLLKGSGEELRGELLDMGMQIDPRKRYLLNHWMMMELPRIQRRMLAATRTGWHRDRSIFVMPDGCIGPEAEHAVFQSEHVYHDEFTRGGTLAGWRSELAALCVGNPMLQLGVSAALAGPLLALVQRTGIGLHFVHASSAGKSSILRAAASVWGGDDFIRTWRATANGLESVAASLNDTALILDEIGEADPREIGAIVYAIGNGMGKSRATRHGTARKAYRWRVVMLSSGENSLETILMEAGKRIKAGQAVRMLNTRCGRTHGVFDELHGRPDGRTFSDALRDAALDHYGHAGQAFIERLVDDDRDFSEQLNRIVTRPEFTDTDPLAGRAATSFAIIGLAGELGIEYGLLPWPKGSAIDAAALAFATWREQHGRGQTETNQILEAVESFIDRHGDSRFSCKDAIDSYGQPQSIPIRDRAGWWSDTADGRVYYFTPSGLREAATGFDFSMTLDALDEAGWIVERVPGKRYKQIKPAGKVTNVYVIRPAAETEA